MIHDDIEDNDKLRRHKPTLWTIWGIPKALITGNSILVLGNQKLEELLEYGISKEKLFFSQKLLLKLVDKGMSRENAYRLVQRNAHAAFDEKINFDIKISSCEEITTLFSKDELSQLFSFDQYTANIDTIYSRIYN